jgi:hypothetical protein
MAEEFPHLFLKYYMLIHRAPIAIVSDGDVYVQREFWKEFTIGLGKRLFFSIVFHL